MREESERHLESLITKLIVVYHKNNLLITYKWVFFDTEFGNALLISLFRH